MGHFFIISRDLFACSEGTTNFPSFTRYKGSRPNMSHPYFPPCFIGISSSINPILTLNCIAISFKVVASPSLVESLNRWILGTFLINFLIN